jgi:hypothetical protein
MANPDGRVNSQENERQISIALRLFAHSNDWFREQGFSLEVAPPRFWYDFCVRGERLFVPVNVKVSAFRTSDNLSSKEGLFYALTGVDPRTVNINSWDSFCRVMSENLSQVPEADYYFMVVNKVDRGDVFWTSLKNLNVLVANGSNPPYQCKWPNNRNRIERTNQEAIAFLLSVLRRSFVKAANPLISFDRYLGRLI